MTHALERMSEACGGCVFEGEEMELILSYKFTSSNLVYIIKDRRWAHPAELLAMPVQAFTPVCSVCFP